MPSPFPGMNPFLENADVWLPFHNAFLHHAQEELAGKAGDRYVVKTETRLLLHERSAKQRRLIGEADVGLALTAGRRRTLAAVAETDAAPLLLEAPLAVETVKEVALHIYDRSRRRLITAIELLSPSNKAGGDRRVYLSKRHTLLRSSANLVEIDLLRGGRRTSPPALPDCDYVCLLKRTAVWPRIEVWPLGLRDRLPRLPIPLDEPDADLVLDVQAILEQTYELGHYAHYLYSLAPQPPLAPIDAAWAAECLRVAGLRPEPETENNA